MSGGVPPSSRAIGSLLRRYKDDAKAAADLFRRFTGHRAEPVEVVSVPPLPKVVAIMGELDGVLYTTVRDGRREKYIHTFRAKDRPLLGVSPDGKQLLIVGGDYDFTERGIVDGSDWKNR